MFYNTGQHSIGIEHTNMFWPVHDFFHAFYDSNGLGKIDCTPYVELRRYRQANTVLRSKYMPIEKEYANEILDAYNKRTFGCRGSWECERDTLLWQQFKSILKPPAKHIKLL